MLRIILPLWLAIFFFPFKANALDIMLPQIYTDDIPVVGWLMSEKLDGVRGYWDGNKLHSKNGNLLYPPPEFIAEFPPFPLEGELWSGRNTFHKTVSIVKTQQAHTGWTEHVKFAIFDVPHAPGVFTYRIQKAQDWFANHPTKYAFVISQKRIKDESEIRAELRKIENLKGEGLIVRNPDALYLTGRNADILKVKNFFDMEAMVVGHNPGQGKHAGRLGSLSVALEDDATITFKIGSGLSDALRDNPPAIGTLITFKYYGFYPSGIPKFPSFLRVRSDRSLSR